MYRDLHGELHILKKKFDVDIAVALIWGKRWSFIAATNNDIFFESYRKIKINEHMGIIVSKWDTLSDKEKGELISSIQSIDTKLIKQ